MKILLHGLNYSPEEIGIGKYSGEMAADWADRNWAVTVVTTPPYYPHWKIGAGFSGTRYVSECAGSIHVIRCPLWVPKQVSGWKRILHLASFGLSSLPVVLWQSITQRPDVVMVVEPAAVCMPIAWLAARICGAKAWLHVQDFEVDAAFELGILKQQSLKKFVLWLEGFWMRRFDRVSSISPTMVSRLKEKGVTAASATYFPNWVDCATMRPLKNPAGLRSQFDIPLDKCVALYAGNVGSKQGLEIIVEAARLSLANPKLHFVICGHGATHGDLVASVRDLPNVQLLPVQPLEKFNELMNAADVHLLPQRADAADLVMPSKLTGMLATGRPVIASASPGTQIAAVVEDHGVVVPPGDAVRLQAAFQLLAEDAELRAKLGALARVYAVEQLSKTAILSRFADSALELAGLQSAPLNDDSETPIEDSRPTGSKSVLPRQRASRPTAEPQSIR